MAPVTVPMMFAVVYLSAKLGQVAGQGLFAVLCKHYSRWVLYPTLIAVLIGNIIEAGADLGGIAAALNLLIPVPVGMLVVLTAAVVLGLQIWGSYTLMRNICRVRALALLAVRSRGSSGQAGNSPCSSRYVYSDIHFNKEFLSMLVAVIGTSLSAYLYTWQSNEEFEEQIAQGRVLLSQRRGASGRELSKPRKDVWFGMIFSNLAMYFIILATAATLFKAGETNINSAADAAQALRSLAGNAAGLLFRVGDHWSPTSDGTADARGTDRDSEGGIHSAASAIDQMNAALAKLRAQGDDWRRLRKDFREVFDKGSRFLWERRSTRV